MLTYAVKLTLLALAFSCASAQSDHTHGNVAMGKLPHAQPLWRLDVALNERHGRSPNPHVLSDDARVFYLQAGQLKAVDAETGRQLWAFQIERGTQLKTSSGGLLAITRGEVYALEPQTGQVRWSKTVAEGVYTAAGKMLYVAAGDRLSAVGLETGRTRWTTDAFVSPYEPLTVSRNHIFIPKAVVDAMSAATLIYDARTGKRLGEASTRGPLAIINQRAFFQNDWFLIDYPNHVYIDVHDLRTGKKLESRTYNVKNRVTGSDWSSKVAVAGAVYISGGGNIACFPLSAPGGKAKPSFIGVPKADVTWAAGPYDGTFLLEWQDALWLVRRQKDACEPIKLLEQGRRLDAGTLAHIKVTSNGMYLGLKNGTFYAINLQTGETVLRLETNAIFGPSHVVGNTLIVQAGNELLGFALPEELRR